MPYLLWCLALGFLGGTFYVDAELPHDLAVLGWFFAAIGWGLAGVMAWHSNRALEGWRQTIKKWSQTTR